METKLLETKLLETELHSEHKHKGRIIKSDYKNCASYHLNKFLKLFEEN